jgi:phage gp36-like protein
MAYATLQDIFLRWGETNVRDAANFNADKPKSVRVTRRIKHFLQIHSDEIEARLLGCAYKVPFESVPPVIRTLCAELAYIAMYRVRHSTDSTAPDPFAYVTARHNQIFADIHARRLRLGTEQQSVDVPMVVDERRQTADSRRQQRENSKKK